MFHTEHGTYRFLLLCIAFLRCHLVPEEEEDEEDEEEDKLGDRQLMGEHL